MSPLKIIALFVVVLFAIDFGSQFSSAYGARSERVRQDRIYLAKGKQLISECPLPLGSTYAESTVNAAVGPLRLAFRDAFSNAGVVLLARGFYRMITENIIAQMAMPQDASHAIAVALLGLGAIWLFGQYGQVAVLACTKWAMHNASLKENRLVREAKIVKRLEKRQREQISAATPFGPEALKDAIAAVMPGGRGCPASS